MVPVACGVPGASAPEGLAKAPRSSYSVWGVTPPVSSGSLSSEDHQHAAGFLPRYSRRQGVFLDIRVAARVRSFSSRSPEGSTRRGRRPLPWSGIPLLVHAEGKPPGIIVSVAHLDDESVRWCWACSPTKGPTVALMKQGQALGVSGIVVTQTHGI